jgi:murein L,D-transpeptidase YcbB/YkuD
VSTRSVRAARRTLLSPLALAAFGVAALTACDRGKSDEAAGDVAAEGWRPNAESIGDVPVAQVTQALRTRLQGDRRPSGVSDDQWRRVKELYGAYGQAPLFLEADGLADRARALVEAVAAAPEEGLRLDEYPVDELRQALEAARGDAGADQYAQADLLLTATYVTLGEDLLTGQVNPRDVAQSWHIDPQAVDVDSALARSLRAARFDQALAGMRPADPAYQRLRSELARYRQIADRGGWGTVPDGETLKPGQRAPAARLQALERRLQIEGLLADAGASQPTTATPASATAQQRNGTAAAPGTTYDARLAGAVAEFQRRHNIVVDSVLGGETLESLNRSAEYRAGQLAANLERHRWLPRSLGSRYILVNVPAFRLEAFENGQPTLTMNVVVGEEYNDRSTPTFSDSMATVVFRPYWNVPDNIAEEEIYPKAAADPGYFASRNYEEVTENGKTRVRQKPGDDNALGKVKFLFPNDFAIYLHDTPEQEAFKQDVRAASHGCIRLEHPAQLAQWVLGWDQARVQQAMDAGPDNQEVTLDRKIPVYIAYFTAYEHENGLWWGNDIYDRDAALVQRMAQTVRLDQPTMQSMQALRELVK